MDNLLITLRGQGQQRTHRTHLSEYRKTLFKHLRSHKFDLVFCYESGREVEYIENWQGLKDLGEKLILEF